MHLAFLELAFFMLTFRKAYANGLPSQAQKARLFCLDHWVSVQSDDSSMEGSGSFSQCDGCRGIGQHSAGGDCTRRGKEIERQLFT